MNRFAGAFYILPYIYYFSGFPFVSISDLKDTTLESYSVTIGLKIIASILKCFMIHGAACLVRGGRLLLLCRKMSIS